MDAYMLRVKHSQLYIGHSANPVYLDGHPYMTVGAYTPKHDGNYYNELILLIGPLDYKEEHKQSGHEWWAWVVESLQSGLVCMDEDFMFSPAEVEFVKFVEAT